MVGTGEHVCIQIKSVCCPDTHAARQSEEGASDHRLLQQMKTLADTLSATGMPLRDDEIIPNNLAGLGSDYDPLVTSITTRSDLMTLDEVYAHLMSYELR